MKTILYYKSIYDQVQKHNRNDFLRVELLAISYDNSTKEKLYRISSDIFNDVQIKSKLVWDIYLGNFIDDDEALALGQLLQPDRDIEDGDGTIIPFTFVLETTEQTEDKKDFSKQANHIFRAFALVLLNEINVIRTEAGLPERTIAQFKAAIKNKL